VASPQATPMEDFSILTIAWPAFCCLPLYSIDLINVIVNIAVKHRKGVMVVK